MKKLLLIVSVTLFTVNVWGQTLDATYLNPKNISSEYKFVRFGESSNYYAGFMYNISNAAYGNGNDFSIFTYGNRDLTFKTGTGNVIFFPSSGGKVGVGTTNPAKKLTLSSNSDVYFRIEKPGYSDFLDFGVVSHYGDISYTAGTSTNSNIRIRTNSATRIFVRHDGNVGIGTTNPSYKLDINDEVGASINTNLQFKGSNILDGGGHSIDFRVSSNQTANRYIARISGIREAAGALSAIAFSTETGSALTEKMRITSNGNIGIGTLSPKTKLHIGSNNSSSEGNEILRISTTLGAENSVVDALHIDPQSGDHNFNKGVAISLGYKSGTYGEYTSRIVHFSDPSSTRASKMQLQTHSSTHGVWNTGILINNVGNVGIGTTSPDSKLDVEGEFRITGTLGKLIVQNSGAVMKFTRGSANYIQAGTSGYLVFNTNGTGSNVANANLVLHTYKSYFPNHSVGIGTSTIPTGYKLAVDGKIICEEVKVEVSENWADFVFEPDYNLMPLKELEAYIKANKHLPEIPTTAEVQENGISIGEMNAKLLQKVEELTLYVIELQKKSEEQDKKIKELENK